MLCMDKNSFDILAGMKLPFAELIKIEDIEQSDERLQRARQDRSLVEFYFTIKPFLLDYILKNYPEVNVINYVDADIYFFGNPEAIFAEIADRSVALTGHRFPVRMQHLEQFGKYNAGWISFKRDENGLACLQWWLEKCFEWCHDYVDGNRYADQKYLDLIPVLFKNVAVIENKGVNLAPWNISNYKVSLEGNKVLINGSQLIFYHFHYLNRLNDVLYDSGFSFYGTVLDGLTRRYIYIPYLKVFSEENKKIPIVMIQQSNRSVRRGGKRSKLIEIFGRFSPGLLKLMETIKMLPKNLYTRSYILYLDGRKQPSD